jgi:hypothetical protein
MNAMDITLALAAFAALFGAWMLVARRRPVLHLVSESISENRDAA